MSDSMNTTSQSQAQMQGQPPHPEKKEEEKKRRVLGFWWWSTAVVSALLLVGILYGLAMLAMSYFSRPGGVEVATQRVENAVIFPVEGADSQGRRAAFNFIIMTDDYTWVRGSTYQVESKGQVVPEDQVAQRVITPQIRESLVSAPELIAVGLASQEGEKAAEEQRAARRARTVASWMIPLSENAKPVWRLNLGQYNRECQDQEAENTSFQRPLIMVGVKSKEPGANLSEALANAISGKSNLPSRECYSQFDLAEAR